MFAVHFHRVLIALQRQVVDGALLQQLARLAQFRRRKTVCVRHQRRGSGSVMLAAAHRRPRLLLPGLLLLPGPLQLQHLHHPLLR